jgi:cob(I)alamin adenosyltransferase
MSFFTRKGDDGYTGLLGEGRVPKSHPRIEALGALDEANATLGLARAFCRVEQTRNILLTAQRDIYKLMAEVAATPDNAAKFRTIDEARVQWLEKHTTEISQSVSVPNEFIIPGDTPASAALDLGRTVVRRAERKVADLHHLGEVENEYLLMYLNRLSSLCFVLELLENAEAGLDTTLAKETP